jgi:pimeloyl-ACP methyl ester carboxylesterase
MMIVSGILIALTVLTGLYLAISWAPELTVEELRKRWALPPSQFLDVAGMKVHMRDEGPRNDASPIVLLHGMSSSLHTWDGWAAALTGRRRVIRFDLAGFGLTGPSPDGAYGIDNDVHLVIAMLDRLGVDHCVLAGNSLGGVIACGTALAHPLRVKMLVLVDSGGYAANRRASFAYFARLPTIDWMVRNTFLPGLVEQVLRYAYADPSKITPEVILRSRELNRREGNRRAFIERARQWRQGALSHRIAELKLPTLIIWGGRDRLISPDLAERFHHHIAGSTLVVFDDLGHMPQEEDPARSVTAMKQFLGL